VWDTAGFAPIIIKNFVFLMSGNVSVNGEPYISCDTRNLLLQSREPTENTFRVPIAAASPLTKIGIVVLNPQGLPM
jgi:hypothetical protein